MSPSPEQTYRAAKRAMARRFETAGLPFADEDALDLLIGLTGLSRTDYALRGSDVLPTDQAETLHEAAERRLSGTPVDRILGWRDFYGRRFDIDHVLSPRGDTEVLLLAALDALKGLSGARVLDLGTGSGALPVTLLAERPDLKATATDICPDALATAQRNAERHGVADRLTLRRSDWWDGLPAAERYDAVLSNPPYITDAAMTALPEEVADHDPALALAGGADGLDPYRVIVPGARDRLRPGGWLGVEIGFDQGEAVTDLFAQSGFTHIALLRDPAGWPRVVHGRRP